ncbi:hypothetical protein WJX72_009783 [[Myrmecia] bisecta]|uniref:Uncharacterized protein n=1 Tax=[Myrmecia] bisecta TaxID=41462 RepID=A0AAW1PUH3_9CHLO
MLDTGSVCAAAPQCRQLPEAAGHARGEGPDDAGTTIWGDETWANFPALQILRSTYAAVTFSFNHKSLPLLEQLEVAGPVTGVLSSKHLRSLRLPSAEAGHCPQGGWPYAHLHDEGRLHEECQSAKRL